MSTEPAFFGPQSFRDLVRLLEQHPEWRAELRRLVLSDDVLELPALVRELAEAQRRTEQRLDALVQRFDVLTQRVDALAEAQRRTETVLQALIGRTDQIETRLGAMRGELLEQRYRTHSGSYFSPLVRRPRPASQDELDDLLERGGESAALSEDDVHDIRRADIVIRGRGREPGGARDGYLVVEVSAVVDRHDVERARRRAAALGKLAPARGVVAGEQITPDAEADARLRGVWQVLDGRVIPPEAANSR